MKIASTWAGWPSLAPPRLHIGNGTQHLSGVFQAAIRRAMAGENAVHLGKDFWLRPLPLADGAG